MVELRILGNYGHYEILTRLQKAQTVTCNSSKKLTAISFVRVTFDPTLVEAVQELLLTCDQEGHRKKWDRIYFHHCQGTINQLIQVVANANVDQFYFVADPTYNYAAIDSPFYLLSNPFLGQVWFENIVITKDMGSMMASSIACHTSLESFSLCHAPVENEALVELANALVSNPYRWKTIRLSKCQLQDDQLSCLLMALLQCKNLSRLFLDGNQCHDKSLSALSLLLTRDKCPLETIDISNQDNGLPTESFSKMMLLLQKNTTVKNLKLQNNHLNDVELAKISTLLVQNSTLSHLDLRFNPISSMALQQIIAPNLARYKGLQRLEVRSGVGVLRQDILNALQENIQDNWSLEKLDIFEWDRRLEHVLDLNRSNRKLLQDDTFPLSLWPQVLDIAMGTTEHHIPSHLRGRKLAQSIASRKASILFYFLRNSPTIFVRHPSDQDMVR